MLQPPHLLAEAAGVTEVDPVLDKNATTIVSFLTVSWVGEQLLSVAIALARGATVSFPESRPPCARTCARSVLTS